MEKDAEEDVQAKEGVEDKNKAEGKSQVGGRDRQIRQTDRQADTGSN